MGVMQHLEGGTCWCDTGGAAREDALDLLHPDRCQRAEPATVPTGISIPEGRFRHCVLMAAHGEPCRRGLERPGGPCHFCGGPTSVNPGNEPGCPRCWTDLTTMPMADIKGLFARSAPEFGLNHVIESP